MLEAKKQEKQFSISYRSYKGLTPFVLNNLLNSIFISYRSYKGLTHFLQ